MLTLDDNFARTRGGAFRNATTGGLVDLTDSSIDGNIAYETRHGGGVYNNGTLNSGQYRHQQRSAALDLEQSANRRDAHGGGLLQRRRHRQHDQWVRCSRQHNLRRWAADSGMRPVGEFNMTDGVIDGNKHHHGHDHGDPVTAAGSGIQADSVANLHNVIISNNETGKDTPARFDTAYAGRHDCGRNPHTAGVGGGFWNTDGSVGQYHRRQPDHRQQARRTAPVFTTLRPTARLTSSASAANPNRDRDPWPIPTVALWSPRCRFPVDREHELSIWSHVDIQLEHHR